VLKKIGRIVLVSCLYYGWHIPSAMAQADAMPISTVQFEGPGGNVGAFPITTGITKLVIGTDGVNLEFSKKEGPNRWPNTCGAPFADPADDCKEDGGRIDMGALQYSMGIVAKVNGQWVASAPIEMWYGRAPSGTGQIQNQEATCDTGSGQLHCNWYYDRNRWPGLFQARFTAGEQLGFFVVAGDARNNYVPLQERSNIVLFTLPATNVAATFEYAAQAGGQPPQTCQDPKANNVGAPLPCTYDTQPPDLTLRVVALEAAKASLEAQVSDLKAQLTDAQGELRAQRDALSSLDAAQHALEAQVQTLVGKPIPVSCSASINLGATRIPISCRLNQ
jgi:hypothetical protein